MFTGIVKGVCPIHSVEAKFGLMTVGIELTDQLVDGLVIGASVAVDGVCLTVTHIDRQIASFDIIEETLMVTTLSTLKEGSLVNIERSLTFGEEVGGHLLSGHVMGVAEILRIDQSENNRVVCFTCPERLVKFIQPKGYIAIDGISLTVIDVDPKVGFSVGLIPETIRSTTLGKKGIGECVNIEIDSTTQTIVNTVERVLSKCESTFIP